VTARLCAPLRHVCRPPGPSAASELRFDSELLYLVWTEQNAARVACVATERQNQTRVLLPSLVSFGLVHQ